MKLTRATDDRKRRQMNSPTRQQTHERRAKIQRPCLASSMKKGYMYDVRFSYPRGLTRVTGCSHTVGYKMEHRGALSHLPEQGETSYYRHLGKRDFKGWKKPVIG